MSEMLEGVFAGVRVVEIGQFVAAPIASELLAHGGADVVRVEPVGGDATRVVDPLVDPHGDGLIDGRQYVVKARGKRAIPVNLSDPAGRQVVADLVADADVFLHNLRPGTPARLGLDYDTLHQRHPGLVYAEINGFGQTGPLAERPSLDLIAQSWTGLRVSSASTSNGDLARYEVYFCDYVAGLLLAFGVASALRLRDQAGHSGTGNGQKVSTSLAQAGIFLQHRSASLFEASDDWKRDLAARHQAGAPLAELLTERFDRSAPDVFFFNSYDTADGRVAIGATGHMGPRLCEHLGLVDPRTTAEWADRVQRPIMMSNVKAAIAANLADRGTEEVLASLDSIGVPAGPVRLLEEAMLDPDAHAAGLFYEAEHPRLGRYIMPGPPVTFSESDYQPKSSFASHGEHTDELLAELGYEQAVIDKLVADGVIARAAG